MAADELPLGSVERAEGPTPNGGAYSVAIFLDDLRRPVPKEEATAVEIQEFDEDGTMIFRTYGELPGPS